MNKMTDEVKSYVVGLAASARIAARQLASASTEDKNTALRVAAQSLRDNRDALLAANAIDVDMAKQAGKPKAFIDRLALDEDRIEGIAKGIEAIMELPDPVGRVLHSTERPNGLTIERVAVPIGVIGMIYESRPNVGADASALCLKSGNAVILRGGSDSRNSTEVIVEAMRMGLAAADLPLSAVSYIEVPNRDAVKHLLHCTDLVDLVIPRGGRGLVELVRDEAKVPTLLHLDGNCHTYIHEKADIKKAVEVTVNAKLRRTGICGATESLVIDRKIAKKVLPKLIKALGDCEVRGDDEVQAIDKRVKPASAEDYDTEYLDSILSVQLTDTIDEALTLVQRHSSGHTDAIITEDKAAARKFLTAIDSAVVMHNASTQFSDGGEFGMGAEIGIATGKMHARGPVGLEQLTSFKYLVLGDGQTRP